MFIHENKYFIMIVPLWCLIHWALFLHVKRLNCLPFIKRSWYAYLVNKLDKVKINNATYKEILWVVDINILKFHVMSTIHLDFIAAFKAKGRAIDFIINWWNLTREFHLIPTGIVQLVEPNLSSHVQLLACTSPHSHPGIIPIVYK